MSLLDDIWRSEIQVGSPEFGAETAIADVWKVKQLTGQDAALKIYKNGSMGNGPVINAEKEFKVLALFLEALDGLPE